ncbi:MAG TPA: hypothetical protein VKU44_11740 [Terriglobia bacterium]|jgi:uncharacterized membrane protein|nr:hypothetical protein [Terriglobia bacterium]
MSDPTVQPPAVYQPPPPPAASPTGVSPNRGLMIALSYLWLLSLIPLLAEKDDREVQWHAKHGLVLTMAEFILWMVIFVIGFVLTHVVQSLFRPTFFGGPSPQARYFGCALSMLDLAIFVGILVLHGVCIIKGTKGQRVNIPVISRLFNS